MVTSNPDVAQLISDFFSQPNELDRDWLKRPDPASALINDRLSSLVSGSLQPVPLAFKGTVRGRKLRGWFIVCPPGIDAREVSEQLRAFVGDSYSGSRIVSGQVARCPHPAISVHFPQDSVVFWIPMPSGHQAYNELTKAIALWLHVRDEAKPRVEMFAQSAGRALRDFYQAVESGRRSEAELLLRHLQDRFPMDGISPSYLKIYLLGRFQDWDGILTCEDLGYLLRTRPPKLIADTLIKAVYCCYLESFETSGDAQGAFAVFKNELLPEYGRLFREEPNSRDHRVLKMYMLLAAASDPMKPELRDAILASQELDPDELSYLCQLGQSIPPTELEQQEVLATDPLERALQFVHSGMYSQAIGIAICDLPISASAAQIALTSAVGSGLVDHAASALGIIAALNEGERTALLDSPVYGLLYNELLRATDEKAAAEQAVEELPRNWCEWVTWVRNTTLSARQVSDLSEEYCKEWRFSDLLSAVTDFVSLLEDAFLDDVAVERLRNLFPQVWGYLSSEDPDYPNPALHRLYDMLRLMLVLDCESHGLRGPDLDVFYDLCSSCLQTATVLPSDKQQGLRLAMISELKRMWELDATLKNTPVIFDAIDMFLLWALNDSEKNELRNLAIQAAEPAIRKMRSDRLELECRLIITQIADELQLVDLLPITPETILDGDAEDAAPESFSKLSGLIVIHSLMETAANRAKRLIEVCNSQCEVVVDSSKVGNAHLRDLAKNASVFVMVTTSAKHAATTFIEACRGDGQIVIPDGRGSSAILRALRQCAQ